MELSHAKSLLRDDNVQYVKMQLIFYLIYADLDDEVIIRCEFVDSGLWHIDSWFPFTHSTTRIFSFNIYNANRFIKCYGFSLFCMNTRNLAYDFVKLVFDVKEIVAFRAINQTPFVVDSI